MCYIKEKNQKKIKETKPHYTFNLEMIIRYDSRLIREKSQASQKAFTGEAEHGEEL